MRKNNKLVYNLTYSAVIAAVYVVLTMVFAPIGFGPIQFRISEALTVLPFFTPAAIPGLFLGCLIANLLGSAVVLDVVFGSLATLIGAIGSYLLRRHKYLVCLPPILANTIMVPWILRYGYGLPDWIPYMMLTVGIGEIIAIGGLGNMLLLTLERYQGRIFRLSYSHK